MDITEHHHKTPVKVAPNTKGSSIQSFSKADDFYAKVPKHLIQELYQFCKLDYDMFGYPPPTKYMEWQMSIFALVLNFIKVASIWK